MAVWVGPGTGQAASAEGRGQAPGAEGVGAGQASGAEGVAHAYRPSVRR